MDGGTGTTTSLPLEMLIYISQQVNNEWMNNPEHYQPTKFTRKLAPFLTKVFLAGKAIGVTHRMDNRQSVKVLAKQRRLAEFKELVLSSARLRPLEDKLWGGPTEIDCRTNALWWLRARMGFLHLPGWMVGITPCLLCGHPGW